jgi:hypothetical protein
MQKFFWTRMAGQKDLGLGIRECLIGGVRRIGVVQQIGRFLQLYDYA